MNDIAVRNDRRMTVREVAEQLGCNPETVKGHIRELCPGLMQNGKTTYLSEKQVTVILEKMKQPVSSGTVSNLQSQIAGTETALTPALSKKNGQIMTVTGPDNLHKNCGCIRKNCGGGKLNRQAVISPEGLLVRPGGFLRGSVTSRYL
jgi:hypothetical protein